MTMPNAARESRDRPYHRDADARVVELSERATRMPKDLAGLLHWFAEQWTAEIPAELHTAQVWRDRVSSKEAEAGVKPVGGSETGALAYAEDFRRRLENGPAELDHRDPETVTSGRVYFSRPLSAAISRISRDGKQLMARNLVALGLAGFDWRKVADRGSWAHEMYEVYIREALIRCWREHREWTRSD